MKKSDFWAGFLMFLAGLAFLLAALLLDTPFGSLFCGFAGGFGAGGLVLLIKYFRWSSPRYGEEYREKLELEQIDLRDERKEKLRNRSGRYAYILGLILTSVSILAFYVMGKLDVIGEGMSRLIVIYLGAFLIVQYVSGLVIYHYLSGKY